MNSNDFPVKLAKNALETYVNTGKTLDYQEDIPEIFNVRSGVFVCLKVGGELRGCVGTIEPVTENVTEEIVRNVVASATDDPRFMPVTYSELERMSYSVDVLGKPERADGAGMLDPKKYGVIVVSGDKRGLLLPDLDGVDTAEQQIEIALKKGSIGPGTEFELFRFEVTRYE